MGMPGFTAGASVYQTKGQSQHAATRVGARGHNAVLAQSKYSRANAEHIRDVVGFGEVRCVWDDYCEGNMGKGQCGTRQICYWWPY